MSEEDKQNEHDEQLMRDHWLSDLAPIVNSDDNLTPEEELPMSDKDTADILNEVSLRFPTKETTGERASDDLLLDEALAFGATADESQDQNAPKLSEDKMQILLGEVRKQFGERSENTERPTKEKIIPFKPIFSALGVAAALVIGFFIFKRDNEPISLVGNSNEDNSMGGAIVLSFKGEARVSEVERGERSEFRKLEDRDLLASGTEIETGEGGEAILLLTNGSLVTVGSTTRLKISQFNQEPFEGTDEKLSEITNEPSQSKILFDLDFGDLVVDVKKLDKKSSFNIQSQLGVAGIRGTQYRILATSETAQISVLEGKVSVESKMKQDHLIDSKKGILLTKDLTNLPKLASDEELNLIDQITKKAQQLAQDIKLSDLAEALDDLNDEFAQLGGAKYFVKSAANMEMIWCEPGTFLIGNPEGQGVDRPHQVRLTKGFYLGKYEVTQEEYERVMGENPSAFKGAQLPVEQVSWIKAMRFCVKLTEMETKSGRLLNGWVYTLPTEAQWEYACRAGTKTAYSWGNEINPKLSNYVDSSLKKTVEVGTYLPNHWGFYDMHGNVREWCWDWLGPYPKGTLVDPDGPNTGERRVDRGGSYKMNAAILRSAQRGRGSIQPSSVRASLGFRLCLKREQASIPDKVNLSEGLAGWWKFDEKEGKVAMDSSGKNRNGELKNFDSNTSQWVVGPVGNAISLDGIDDFIDVGDFEWGGELSFSAWVKYKKFQNWSRVFDFGVKFKNNDIYLTNGKSQSNSFHLTVRAKDINGLYLENVLDSNTWYHLAFSLDSQGYLTAYSQGKIIAPKKWIISAKKMMRKNQFLGKSQSKNDAYLNGILDDLRIYDRAINESEIKSLFALGDLGRTKIGLVDKQEISNNEHNKTLILEPKHKAYETLEPVRIFKSVRGTSFEGRVLSYEGNNFFLEGKDAKIISVTLNQLSKEDQKYLQETVQAGKIGTRNPHETGPTPVEGKP